MIFPELPIKDLAIWATHNQQCISRCGISRTKHPFIKENDLRSNPCRPLNMICVLRTLSQAIHPDDLIINELRFVAIHNSSGRGLPFSTDEDRPCSTSIHPQPRGNYGPGALCYIAFYFGRSFAEPLTWCSRLRNSFHLYFSCVPAATAHRSYGPPIPVLRKSREWETVLFRNGTKLHKLLVLYEGQQSKRFSPWIYVKINLFGDFKN